MIFCINRGLKQIVCCVVDLLELRDGIKVFADNPVSILKGDGSNDVDIQFFPYLAYAALGNTEMFSAIGDAFPLSKHLR